MMGILPDTGSWDDWTTWASKHVVRPVKGAIFNPFVTHLSNLKLPQAAALINHPHTVLSGHLKAKVTLEHSRVYGIVTTIRQSNVKAFTQILEDYLARLESIELAVSSLLGRQLPIVMAIFSDLHALLGKPVAGAAYPAALPALFDEVSGAFVQVLHDLQIIAGKTSSSPNTVDLEAGHFYDWVCCKTEEDRKRIAADDERTRVEQQRLRLTMMKVILTYIDNVEVSPGRFRAGAPDAHAVTSFGGFPLSSTGTNAVLQSADGGIRAFAGLVAAAFEHAFVSSRPLSAEGPADAADVYHSLPLTLKMQRPDLSRLAFARAGYSPFSLKSVDLESNSEFLAMRVATTSANFTAGTLRTAITCIGNGVWEISPNNPPLVDTIARLVAIPVYELEKAVVYDVLRRFRVYVTDQPLEMPNDFVLIRASMQVPDFTGASTEKTLTAVVAVTPNDKALLEGARHLLGNLPISLDADQQVGESHTLAGQLYGMMKDSLAACYVFNA